MINIHRIQLTGFSSKQSHFISKAKQNFYTYFTTKQVAYLVSSSPDVTFGRCLCGRLSTACWGSQAYLVQGSAIIGQRWSLVVIPGHSSMTGSESERVASADQWPLSTSWSASELRRYVGSLWSLAYYTRTRA